MTNVIVTNPDYRLAPVYYYSLFLILQVIGNLYFYFFPTGCFFISGIASIGSGVYLFLYFLFYFQRSFVLFCLFWDTFLFFLFSILFFPCMDLAKTITVN